ncbi:MAG: purine-nucleoside phosphorylase [Chthoniobacterales bacterium]|nr:purine-nucleoside phosphorylase [Chthoniobacterales bacterium]
MSDRALQRLRDWGADTAVILGSGLSCLAAEGTERISYAEFAELPRPKISGHGGHFVAGRINDRPVIYAQGRVHLYEGHSAMACTAGVRLLASADIKRIILTNAAGAMNPNFPPGEWMMIADHLNLTGTTPLLGTGSFIDMTDVYSRAWRAKFAAAAAVVGIKLREGVYAGVLGPQYETPAEVRMVRQLGADAIGMSTVLEAIQAHALGVEVAAFSCLTNWAAGMGADHLDHADVLKASDTAAAEFARLLSATL